MKIKFLQTTPSDHPAAPFQAGQIIDIPLSEQVRAWVDSGAAVALEGEATVLGAPPEQATDARPRKRGSR